MRRGGCVGQLRCWEVEGGEDKKVVGTGSFARALLRRQIACHVRRAGRVNLDIINIPLTAAFFLLYEHGERAHVGAQQRANDTEARSDAADSFTWQTHLLDEKKKHLCVKCDARSYRRRRRRGSRLERRTGQHVSVSHIVLGMWLNTAPTGLKSPHCSKKSHQEREGVGSKPRIDLKSTYIQEFIGLCKVGYERLGTVLIHFQAVAQSKVQKSADSAQIWCAHLKSEHSEHAVK